MATYSDDPSYYGPQLPGVDTVYVGPTISITPAYKSALDAAGVSLSSPAARLAFNTAFSPASSWWTTQAPGTTSTGTGPLLLLGVAAVAVLLLRRR